MVNWKKREHLIFDNKLVLQYLIKTAAYLCADETYIPQRRTSP
jgi:hypothetical protein